MSESKLRNTNVLQTPLLYVFFVMPHSLLCNKGQNDSVIASTSFIHQAHSFNTQLKLSRDTERKHGAALLGSLVECTVLDSLLIWCGSWLRYWRIVSVSSISHLCCCTVVSCSIKHAQSIALLFFTMCIANALRPWSSRRNDSATTS